MQGVHGLTGLDTLINKLDSAKQQNGQTGQHEDTVTLVATRSKDGSTVKSRRRLTKGFRWD